MKVITLTALFIVMFGFGVAVGVGYAESFMSKKQEVTTTTFSDNLEWENYNAKTFSVGTDGNETVVIKITGVNQNGIHDGGENK